MESEYYDPKSYPIIAVDFDGVLCENAYPDIGEPRKEVINYILKKQKEGATLILWTSRIGSDLVDAVQWCCDHGIKFDYINENAKEVIEEFGTDTRKIYADYYIDDHNLPVEECREKSNMEKWAEREVEIATKDKNCENENDYYYILSCYQSALKAYKSLCNDGHSGMSFGITKSILESLMNENPLTPIEDNEEDWILTDLGEERDDFIKCYHCKRKSSLFKKICKDGTVKYNDIDRFYCYNENNGWGSYHSVTVDNVLDELYPITMPYSPSNRAYHVNCEEWLTNEKNGDFDTLGIIDVIKPDGTKDDIHRYFKFDNDKETEITEAEYRVRIVMHHEREDEKMDKEDEE